MDNLNLFTLIENTLTYIWCGGLDYTVKLLKFFDALNLPR